MMPGRILHRLAATVCSTHTVERIVEPAIADLQKEYWAVADRVRRVRVLMAGYAAILQVIALCALRVRVSRDDGLTIVRTMAWSFTLMIAVTAVLMLPPLSMVDGSVSTTVLASLIPQAVPLAIPIGLAFGIALGMSRCTHTRATMRVILLFALAGSLVSFATLAWLMPASNQRFRESLTQKAGVEVRLTKGPNEMTFSELKRQAAIAAHADDWFRSGTYAWAFHLRFALSVASIVLAGLLLVTPLILKAARILAALLACVAYWALLYAGEGLAIYSSGPGYHHAGTIPIIVGAWLPNIGLAAAAMLIAASRSLRLRGQRGVVQ